MATPYLVGPQNEVVAGQRRLGTAGAVAGDGAPHEPRRIRLEPGVGEAPLVERAEFEVIDQHVGIRDQLLQYLLALGARHVERDRALVSVGAEEISRLAGRERRAPAAGVVARARRLDLDHVGAHVAEHHCAQGSREDAREIHHTRPGHRPGFPFGHCAACLLRMDGGSLRLRAQPSR
jgi:hypothetical protein